MRCLVDVPAGRQANRWSAEAIDKIYDEVVANPRGSVGPDHQEPVGGSVNAFRGVSPHQGLDDVTPDELYFPQPLTEVA